MTSYDVAVLGAGPSGLTAAYCLGMAGARVAVVERAPQCGGLMRGVRRGDFVFDLGRKELYARFPEVHRLWTELLGDDYREYPHRVGLLYEGRILEKDATYKGRFRGMSASQIARLAGSYVASQARPGSRVARSVEDFYLLRYGRLYYDFFFHGYNLKFDGRSPAEVQNPDGAQTVPRFGFLRPREPGQQKNADPLFSGQSTWRHPAKGTQQIVDRLEEGSRKSGVDFLFGAEVLAIEVDATRDHRVSFRNGAGQAELSARYLVSSVPLPLLARLLQPEVPEDLRTPPAEEVLFKKSTALVYLLADGEPKFPHNWLEVNDLRFKMGRVVNYATWNGLMVPKGKTALCVEYFALEGDPVMALSEEGLLELAIQETAANGLIDPGQIEDHLVLRLPNANASTVIHDRKQAWLRNFSDYVSALPRFFETNRPGMDRATLAGIDAAEACLSGQPMRDRSLATSSLEL